jgi:hypothetical protein
VERVVLGYGRGNAFWLSIKGYLRGGELCRKWRGCGAFVFYGNRRLSTAALDKATPGSFKGRPALGQRVARTLTRRAEVPILSRGKTAAMTIEIHQPRLEELIGQRMASGHYPERGRFAVADAWDAGGCAGRIGCPRLLSKTSTSF